MDTFAPKTTCTRFTQLSEEVCNLLHEKIQDKARINGLVDQLNALNYKSGFFVSHHDAVNLITAISHNVNPSDSTLAAKAAHLLNNILTKQNLHLPAQAVKRIIVWDVTCLECCSKIVFVDLLNNLHIALNHIFAIGSEFTEQLIGRNGILLKLLKETDKPVTENDSSNLNLDIILLIFKCILTLMVKPEDKAKDKNDGISSVLLQPFCDIIINFLYKGYHKSYEEFIYCKVVVHAMRILTQVYFDYREDILIPLPEVMGLSKHFLFYGLLPQSTIQKISPSQQTIAQPVMHSSRGGKRQKLRKQRNSAIESLKKEIPTSDRSLTEGLNNFEGVPYAPVSQYLGVPVTKFGGVMMSDSDVSDGEGGRDARLIALRTRVRQSASNLLLVLIKVTEKKVMFGYWWALLPDSPDPDRWSEEEADKRSLAYLAINDPMSVCRAASLSVMLALLAGSKMYLSQAELCKREITSFTPFSVRLGHTISCLHRALGDVLRRERASPVVLAALKCVAALVQATPYHRMQAGLITHIVAVARSFLLSKNHTMQAAALVVIGCVLSVDPAVDEILQCVQKDTEINHEKKARERQVMEECDDFEEGYSDDEDIFTARVEEEDEESGNFDSWILDICLKHLGWTYRSGVLETCNPSQLPLMLESLQVICALSFHHFTALLCPHIRLLGFVLAALLDSEHVDLVYLVCKTVSSIADAILKVEQAQPGSPPLIDCLFFWETLLCKPLPLVLQQSDNPDARAVACDCIANIGDRIFKELPRVRQVMCVTLLSGSCGEVPVVRAAAVRALAVCAFYTSLREDPCFVSDCSEKVLRLAHDKAPPVRVKAVWALANLCDALVLNLNDPEIENVDNQLLVRLLEMAVECASASDKIRMSATRAIGNLLRLVTADNSWRNVVRRLAGAGLERLVACAGRGANMKLRWNACYAIGNALRNTILCDVLTDWQKPVFSCLCSNLEECKNLKVKINAAAALRSLSSRERYAEHLASVWRALLAAVEAADNIEDHTEYQHKDQLVEQLCVTVAHLTCLLKASDLSDILDSLNFYSVTIKEQMAQVTSKLPPEHESCRQILEAAKYVTVSLSAENDSQGQALRILQDLFVWESQM